MREKERGENGEHGEWKERAGGAPAARRRILIVIGTLQIGGGAEKVAATVGSELTARGHEVHLLTFYEAKQKYPYTGIYHTEGEPIITNRLKKIWRVPWRVWKIQRYARRHNIEVAISFLEEANFYTLLAKLFGLWRLPVVVSVRNNIREREWPFRLATCLLYPFAHRVVAVTRAIEDILRSDYRLSNTTTIYNPLEYEQIHARATEPLPAAYEPLFTQPGPVCITVGRLTKQKGQWHLIRAFTAVRAHHPQAKLIIVGAGEDRAKLEALVAACDLTDAVQLIGRQENVYRFVARADVFVFASLWEGMPNTVLEALALGVPIVAPDCVSGPREILAPDVGLHDALDYPYQTAQGTLVAPLTSAYIWSAPQETPLTAEEAQLASVISQQLTKHIEQNEQQARRAPDPRFTLETIVGEWERLCEKAQK